MTHLAGGMASFTGGCTKADLDVSYHSATLGTRPQQRQRQQRYLGEVEVYAM